MKKRERKSKNNAIITTGVLQLPKSNKKLDNVFILQKASKSSEITTVILFNKYL